MRPFRSFLLLLIFLVCFTGLYYVIPAHWHLKLPNVREFFPFDADFDFLPADTGNIILSVIKLTEEVPPFVSDTISGTDSLTYLNEPPPSYPLQEFLDTLQYSKGQVRIMYYGDSQIEGDRVTSYLRQVLREGRSGTGPGLFLPQMPVMYTRSIHIRSSSNWERFNYLSYKSGEIPHSKLGPFMAFCRFLPDGQLSSIPVKAWIRIVPSRFADTATSSFDLLRIFYRNSLDAVNIQVRSDGFPPEEHTLEISPDINEFKCSLYNSKNIIIEFSGRTSPDIYGISIESETGIIVDNIPQRGSAGLEFTMVDRENLEEIYRILSPRLVVLHYGLNIVKNVRENYSYYERGLFRQLSLLKSIMPDAEFLVVGVTDMAQGEGENLKSYPNIPIINEAQRNAAKVAGAIFWDAYKAMGGLSSVIRWANMKPPLAQKDFVHFTNQGADTVSGMLIRDIFTKTSRETITATIDLVRTDSIVLSHGAASVAQPSLKETQPFSVNLISLIFSYDPDKPFIFSNTAFWIFFLIILAGYSLIYKKNFLRNLYLFLVSLFFYYKSGGLFLILLIIVTLVDFFCGLLIFNSRSRSRRRLFLLISIISNIGILAYFKYTGFFIETLNSILGTNFIAHDFILAFSNNLLGTSFDISNIILPVGISFFTFQSLSYTFDLYRRKLEPVRNVIDFGFYVSFFPQLVAGPIVRASEFIPQLYNKFQLTQREFSHSLFLISKGLIKKVVISDFIAVNFIDRVFDMPSLYSGFENLVAIFGYGLQIYCDFSGYTDIAIGVALILGFRLPVNFNSPYKADSVTDFWRRWHISLSRWLKDYLYISLGGNRKGRFRTVINLMITMLLGGLWHGAALRFILWGGLHGLGLVLHKLWTFMFGEKTNKKWYIRAMAVFITFNFVSFCWIFFRAPDIHHALLMLNQIATDFSPGSYISLMPAYGTIFSLILAGYIVHFLPEKVKESYRGLFIRIPLVAQMVVIMLVAVLLFQMRTTEVMPFIYFRF